MLRDLITRNRSYRRFFQDVAVEHSTLVELVELARRSPSAANRQPLKYVLVSDAATCARVFPCLAWAGYLADWPGPVEGEQPAAYMVMLGDKDITATFGCDHGIAAQSILLGAVERGLGGCIIGSIQRELLCATLAIPTRYEVLLVLALGRPKETVVLEPLGPSGGIKYWRDEHGVHHVPKRPLADLILGCGTE